MNKNHKSNQLNPNTGTTGLNSAYQKMLHNRSNQLNPNNPKYKLKK
jgi:hypothetical protein